MPEYRKKLIEVALPLEAINKESAREKSIRHGHPSTLHLWWARRPLAACRAVLFAQMVDDPSSLPDEFPTEEMQEVERQRLFHIIEELVKWENTTKEAILHAARIEIARSAARNHGISLPHNMTTVEVTEALKRYAPPLLDPFAGGGSIPLEAQRLGLEAHASDLNPVAVLINKALIEIPPKFACRPPVNPESREKYLQKEWKGAEGLAEDVRYYGKWIRDEAWRRIGHLYPKVHLPKEYGSGEAIVIAWLWARTVTCPNPACNTPIPLVRTFWLSTKKDREVWAEPILDRSAKMVRFEVKQGKGAPEGTVHRQGAICIACGTPAGFDYLRSEGKSGRMGTQLIAIVAEGLHGRVYLSPTLDHIKVADEAKPMLELDQELQGKCRVNVSLYGMNTYGNLFTSRQLVALTTFSDLVQKVREKVLSDADIAGLLTAGMSVNDTDTHAYANAVATYLGLGVSKMSDYNSSLVTWSPTRDQARGTFTRQALPMVWDFAEVNLFARAAGDLTISLSGISGTLERNVPATASGRAQQFDATVRIEGISCFLISTDPPYYDNISYADLSDFFYIWLRRSLGSIYSSLFTTLLVPKTQELIAAPYRFGGERKKAKGFFEEGLGKAFGRMFEIHMQDYPMTVYYAFKQAESEEDDSGHEVGSVMSASTGWETMLEGLLKSGFSITGTWPMRSERGSRVNSFESNSLASSIVLVCRSRSTNAQLTTRRDFLNALKRELPNALKDLQRGNIAPVDLAQAAIGPGMAVFSRYNKVLESNGTPMRVRTALQLINQMLDEVLAEQEGEYDADTRWAVAWFEQYGMEEGPYGVAETLSKAKNTAVGALVEAGILRAQGGKVRLLRRDEFSSDWNPATAKRLTVWEVTQRLIRALEEYGDTGAAGILNHVGAYGEVARDLSYRLYTICERKKWADEALAYNSLVVEWSEIGGAVEQLRRTTAEQARLF